MSAYLRRETDIDPASVSAAMSFSRRRLLQALSFSTAGLTLSDACAARAPNRASGRGDTAVIFVQLGGGASQFETYDPKPAAPAEYRGATKAIATSVPGIQICELFRASPANGPAGGHPLGTS